MGIEAVKKGEKGVESARTWNGDWTLEMDRSLEIFYR